MSIQPGVSTVLVIEENHEARVALRKLLEESFGLTVLSAPNPIDGLAVLNKIKSIVFILLATQLPLMTYEEFLNLKNRNEAIASVPVILLSATPLASLPSGARACVQSPVNRSELCNAINEIIS